MSRSLRISFSFALVALALTWSVPMFAADGAALYKSKCAMCHGADGSGNTPVGKTLKVKDLSSADIQKQTDAQLEEAISKGKGKMPAFGGKVSSDELKALVAYIRTFKK